VMSAVYGLRAAARVFFGPQTEAFARFEASKPVSDITWGERLPALVLIAALLFVGVWPRSISTGIDQALAARAPAVRGATPQ